MNMLLALAVGSVLVSGAVTPLGWVIARACGFIDTPDGARKRHQSAVPLGGGIALFVALVLSIGLGVWLAPHVLIGAIPLRAYAGIALGGLVIVCGGLLDDAKALKAKWQILFPVLAACMAIGGGVEIARLTNPFGGVWEPGIWSPVLVFVWLMVSMYTTKLLDGVDGLAVGVGSVGAALVALLASTTAFFQADIRLVAVVVASIFLGFLFWNRPAAVGYLGEGGSVLIGYVLGALAVLSGSKVATLFLVLAIPMLDVAWVVWSRYRRGVAPWKGDRTHLHHWFLERGWSAGGILVFYMSVSALCGALSLLVPRPWKYVALLLVLLGVIGWFARARSSTKNA